MFLIMLFIISTAAAGMTLSRSALGHDLSSSNRDKLFFALILGGFLVRAVFAVAYYGFQSDVNDFLSWSDMLYKGGLAHFYASDAFTDYPPGYMYILWVIGFLKNIFSLSGTVNLLLIKLPAILSDMGISILLYRYFPKKNDTNAVLLSALFIFNPAVILNSSIWGQVDSVMTLALVITILLLTEGKLYAAYFAFALSIFIKPQAFMYAPLLLYGLFADLTNAFTIKKLKNHVLYAIGALLCVVLLSLPFGLTHILHQYIATLSSYPHLSVNAFNLWAALGENWADLTPLSSGVGTFFLFPITLASFYILHKSKDQSKYFFVAAFLCFSTFMLSVKMHERYAYPAMALMLFAIGGTHDFRRYKLYILLTMSQLFNTAYVLLIYAKDPSIYYNNETIIVASILNLFVFLYLAYTSDHANQPLFLRRSKQDPTPEKSIFSPRLSHKEIGIVAVIILAYAFIAFYALGDRSAPQNEYMLKANQEVTLTFDKPVTLKTMKYFLGPRPLDEEHTLTVLIQDEQGRETDVVVENEAAVFYWSSLDMKNASAKSVTLMASKDLSLKELSIEDDSGEIITPTNQADYPELFDEQLLVPTQETYLNSTYFDEIYHARTAYEFIHKLPVYEWTHPPLGKFIISIGIRLFGMAPFGWRCMGVLFGIFMIPVIYLMAKLLLKQTWLCTITTLLFTFDFMHYTQTRIATIDSYVTFFIMLMYLYMFRYAYISFYDTPFKKSIKPLLLCGIATGLASACKWTGIYAISGIAAIFILVIARRYQEYRAEKLGIVILDDSETDNRITKEFPKKTVATILLCCVFFILIPLAIYMLAYIPYLQANGEGISGIWKNQIDIFTYHSKTVVHSQHSYASPWYSWPIIFKPIWYYANTFSSGNKAGISALGNPLVWWPGIAAFFYCLYRVIFKKDKVALLLVIAYLSNYLPWVGVKRTTFIYHYFPSVPFVVLMIGYSIRRMVERVPKLKIAAIIYAAVAVLLFAAFYPVLTGTPVNTDYVSTFLSWFPSWFFV